MSGHSRCLIVGAGGKVGTDVALRLRESGHSVVAASRFSDRERRERLETAGILCQTFCAGRDPIEVLAPDVDHVWLMQVVHLDAEQRPVDAYKVTTLFSGQACEYWRNASAIVVTGTFNTYGRTGYPLDESVPPQPRNVYESSRHAQERIVAAQCRRLGVPAVVMRICYGQHPRYGMLRRMAELLQTGQPLPSSSGKWMNIIDHRDLVRYLTLAPQAAAVPMRVLNLTSPEPYAVTELLAAVAERIGVEAPDYDADAHEEQSLYGYSHQLVECLGPPEHDLQSTLDYVFGELS